MKCIEKIALSMIFIVLLLQGCATTGLTNPKDHSEDRDTNKYNLGFVGSDFYYPSLAPYYYPPSDTNFYHDHAVSSKAHSSRFH